MRVEGKIHQLLYRLDPFKDVWRVAYDVREEQDGVQTWEETTFYHLPTMEEIKSTVISYWNAQCDEQILSGHRFEGELVWLSTENQSNYKAAFDLAIQTGGAILPITFKLGTEEQAVYREFGTMEELRAFYLGAFEHVNRTLSKYWQIKDGIDWDIYYQLLNQ